MAETYLPSPGAQSIAQHSYGTMHIDLLRGTRYATYAYLVAVPGLVESLNLLGMHDTARALQAALCCLAVAAWALSFQPSQHRLSVTHISLVGLAGTLTVVSIWQAQWPLFAATEACLWFGLIALAWVFSKSPLDVLTKEIPGVVAIAIFAMGAQELMSIGFAWLSSSPLSPWDVGRGHPNVRHFNHVQTMALIMAAMTIWYPTHRWMRWTAGFGVAVGLALAWLTGARSTLLAVFLISVGFLILSGPARRTWSARLLWLGIAGVVAYLLFYVLIPQLLGIEVESGVALNEREHKGSIETRLIHWKLAFEMALQNPLTGWGGVHYATQHHVDAAHPHNIVLQWAAEWGWVSTLLALFALGWWTRKLWLAMWQRLGGAIWPYTPVITAAWMATLAGWIDAMFSGTLTMPVSQVWWCFCLGLACHSDIERCVLPVRTCSLQRSWFKKLLGGATVLALLATTFISYKTTYQEKPEAALDQSFIKPRLWVSGSIR